DGTVLANRYRTVFLGLANDTGDDDGQPLPKDEHNYLEVFGIPPSLSVLRARFAASAADPCGKVDFAKIQSVRSLGDPASKKEQKDATAAPTRKTAFSEVEKRLACEVLYHKKRKHSSGRLDESMRDAI